MKKFILGFAVLTAMCVASCGNNAEKQEVVSDTTVAVVETVDSTMVDSTAVVADTVKVDEAK